jgi:hypothetical protein
MTRSMYSLWPWTPTAASTPCLATDAPNQPGGLTATGGVGTISLSWTADSTAAPNQATYYEVERSIDGLGSWSVIATNLGTNSYTDTVASGLTRYYRVYAYNCDSGSLASATANATSQASTPTAAWSLDFSSGTPSGYTLTRASSGTYVDSSGYIASAATDVARLTHNSSGSRLGLLVEESRTNNVQQSNAYENAWWTETNGTTCSNQTTPLAPNNATETARVRETSANSLHARGRGVPALGLTNARYTWSVYLKKETRQYVGLYAITVGGHSYRVIFDLNSGSFSAENSGGTPNGAYSISDQGNGWYRCSISFDMGATEAYFGVFLSDRAGFTGTLSSGIPSYTGSTSEGVYVWGAQMELGSAPTSLIPTTTASVTRSADLAHVLDSSITSWGDPGALVVHFYPPGKAGTILSTDDASTAQVGIEASSTTAARAFWSSGSTSTGTIGTGVQKAVHYWNGSTSKFCINGGTVQSGTNNLTIGNTDFVTLGAEATDSSGVPGTFSQYANCVIRKVEFYSGTLTDANLQTITT